MSAFAFVDRPPRSLFFTGKGGVGKTSLACACAIALADGGARVLLVSTDPASNVAQVFAIAIGNRITAIPEVARLWALEIDPQAAAQAYRDRPVGPVRGGDQRCPAARRGGAGPAGCGRRAARTGRAGGDAGAAGGAATRRGGPEGLRPGGLGRPASLAGRLHRLARWHGGSVEAGRRAAPVDAGRLHRRRRPGPGDAGGQERRRQDHACRRHCGRSGRARLAGAPEHLRSRRAPGRDAGRHAGPPQREPDRSARRDRTLPPAGARVRGRRAALAPGRAARGCGHAVDRQGWTSLPVGGGETALVGAHTGEPRASHGHGHDQAHAAPDAAATPEFKPPAAR